VSTQRYSVIPHPVSYADRVIENELPESFWTGMLPQLMGTSSSNSPYFLAYQAAQVKLGDKGFLSRDITVLDLLMNRSDVHHVYSKKHLKAQRLSRGRYNQIANFVVAQSNIAIGDKPAREVLRGAGRAGERWQEEVRRHHRWSRPARQPPRELPAGSMLDGMIPDYDDFLEERPKLMALKIKTWFETL
jgi:hypothetical protein